MPIRFRCPQCQQLMGIARRKAGTTVNCTACHSPIVVPAEDDAPETAPGSRRRLRRSARRGRKSR
jgi:hypothetical protein